MIEQQSFPRPKPQVFPQPLSHPQDVPQPVLRSHPQLLHKSLIKEPPKDDYTLSYVAFGKMTQIIP